jgi:hypothetical protein
LDNFLSKGFTEVKEEDTKCFTKDGNQYMVFKTMGNKPVSGFHSEMVNWKKQDTVNVFHSEMVNWAKQDMVFKTMEASNKCFFKTMGMN